MRTARTQFAGKAANRDQGDRDMNKLTEFGEGPHESANDVYAGQEGADVGKPRTSSRKWIIIAVILIAIAAAAAFYMSSRPDKAAIGAEAADEKANAIPAVTVVIPGRGSVANLITASGTLAARRELPVGVAGEGGQVSRVLVDAGTWVRAGQTLAVIDQSVQNQQAQSAQANIKVAQADARLAQSELDRAMKLVERGFISQADIDRKTATRDSANARVNVARAQSNELQARSSRLNIVAPAAGIVLERNVEPGQVVGAGSGVLFRIAKGGEMELQAELSEADLAKLGVGVSATVTPVGSEQSFTGQVWQLSPVINPQSRLGIARVALPYKDALRPGGFANAEISSGASVAPVLPESAVQNDAEGSYVFVVGEGDKIVRRNVQTGIVTANGIAITGGLNGSERVVLYAAGFLNPGDKVKPRIEKSEQGRTKDVPAAKTQPPKRPAT